MVIRKLAAAAAAAALALAISSGSPALAQQGYGPGPAPSSGTSTPPSPGWAATTVYAMAYASLGTCSAAGATTMYAQPQYVPAGANVASLQVRAGTGSGNVKLALYSNVNGRPASLLYSSATTSAAASNTDVTATLTGGPYLFSVGTWVWKTFLADNTTLTVLCAQGNDAVVAPLNGGASFVNIIGTSNLSTGVSAPVTSYAVGFPATFTAIGAMSNNAGNTPIVAVKTN